MMKKNEVFQTNINNSPTINPLFAYSKVVMCIR